MSPRDDQPSVAKQDTKASPGVPVSPAARLLTKAARSELSSWALAEHYVETTLVPVAQVTNVGTTACGQLPVL